MKIDFSTYKLTCAASDFWKNQYYILNTEACTCLQQKCTPMMPIATLLSNRTTVYDASRNVGVVTVTCELSAT